MSENPPDSPSDLQLIPLARVSVGAGAAYKVSGGPFGNRIIAGISDGRWEGERLAGNIVGAGGDWAMPSGGNAMLLDVRQVIQTDDERYAWLNAVQAVGQGRYENGRLNYQMFEVR